MHYKNIHQNRNKMGIIRIIKGTGQAIGGIVTGEEELILKGVKNIGIGIITTVLGDKIKDKLGIGGDDSDDESGLLDDLTD